MHLRTGAAVVAAALASALLAPAAVAAPTAHPAPSGAPRVEAGSPAPAAQRAVLARTLSGEQPGPRSPKVRLVAHASSTTTAKAVRRSAQSLGFTTSARGIERLGFVTVETTAANADRVQARLELLSGVRSVRRATQYEQMWTPNDTKYATQQAGMFNALQAPAAWDVSRGAGATIAVLDGGFQASHPDLAGKVVGTWNVAKRTTDVSDAHGSLAPGHGTAAASVAAAATNNGKGIAGAAPSASLLLVRVSDSLGDIYDDLSAAGIVWAADHGADVISMSYGAQSASDSPAERKAIQYAQRKGVVLVASAGNSPSSTPNYPAASDGVIAVGATNTLGTAQTSWSAYGAWVDLGAPGVGVPVAVPLAVDLYDGIKDGYTKLDGTSFSAPLVAGAAAVLRAAHPLAPPSAIQAALTSTTKAITPQAHGTFAHGLVQFAPALAAVPTDPVITSATTSTPGVVDVAVGGGYSSIRVNAVGVTNPAYATVVDGAGTAQLPTWGLGGSVQIRATGCALEECELAATTTAEVSNPAPVITQPAPGALLGSTTTMAVEGITGQAWVRYLADGSTVLADAQSTSGWGVDLTRLSPGTHQITAVWCTVGATTCDTATPSAPVAVTVEGLRPTVAVQGSSFLSPGPADTRQNSVSVAFTLDTADTSVIGVKQGDTWVRGPIDIASAGVTSPWTWDGRDDSGTLLGDGSYRVVVEQTRQEALPSPHAIDGSAAAAVTLDTTPTVIGTTVSSPRIFYPYADKYLDTATVTSSLSEPVVSAKVAVLDSKGVNVRSLTATVVSGKVRATWNGRTAAGKALPAGRYTIRTTVLDRAGNSSIRISGVVATSWKKLVYRSAVKKLTADGAAKTFYYDRTCTAVFSDARPDVWPSSSLEFVSRRSASACPKGPPYYAFTENKFTLPKAVKYATFSISAYGGGSIDGTGHRDDVAELDYLMRDNDTIGTTVALTASTKLHVGPTVRAPEYLVNGNQIWWLAGTSKGNWYDIRDYTIRWSYYTLV